MKQTEMKRLVKIGLDKTQLSIKILTGSDNPQVDRILAQCEGKLRVLEAVDDMFNNNTISMRILCEC